MTRNPATGHEPVRDLMGGPQPDEQRTDLMGGPQPGVDVMSPPEPRQRQARQPKPGDEPG